MIRDYSKNYNDLTRAMKKLGTRIPGTMKGFTDLHRASTDKGSLSSKTKELIALGIAITVRCDGCIAFHVHDSLTAGASSEEILETIGVAVLMGGGPSVVYGCEAMEALDQFAVLEKNETAIV
ncbi:carboxymuconolactone decarboxylase family protein [Maribacter sp. ACAM166]|uniref:carboxymuconolactone decarboxylase family protein n=1 Tax=Maribacter sp. ACAM166 TaxID=2508996 RepID=UPI0010FD09E8|nr:carboxymuconolactone decarboxylase family protein [Maribacter sp. ACAM166]TLP81749.1 carboxymuconolactone decarboxylase family protein [Maribacter sp. ACAM166]